MTLTLTIAHVDRLDNGSPVSLRLDRRGATIGRSPGCDWSLPDPRHHISSRHCEVTFRDGIYLLTDVSTNGTLLNGAAERMAVPRRIENGDRFQLGQYQIVASLAPAAQGPAGASGWDPWSSGAPAAPAASPWDRPPPAAGGWDLPAAADRGWDRPPAPPPAAPVGAWEPPAAAHDPWLGAAPGAKSPFDGAASGWDVPAAPAPAPPSAPDWPPAPAAAPAAASPWDAPADPPPLAASPFPPVPPAVSFAADDWLSPSPPTDPAGWDAPSSPDMTGWPAATAEPERSPRDDVWGRIDDGNAVDWSRGGFGHGDAGPATGPVSSGASGASAMAAPPAPPVDERPTAPPGPMPAAADPAAIVGAFTAAAGLAPGQIKEPGIDVLERAGSLLRQLVAGLVVMVEARARAKSQMGAESTSLSFDGNNPIKFARAPEQALAQLLNPRERGFMAADAAIEDAFHDLQSHQVATLKAMQGALRTTLDRFSPAAIRSRAESKGVLARIMPGAREAALWQAYEREFGGVAQGSDEAFMDVFAKEFRKAYDEEAGARRTELAKRR